MSPQTHITVAGNCESEDTHNNLYVTIIEKRSSWTGHIGDGVFKLPAVRTHLKHGKYERGFRSFGSSKSAANINTRWLLRAP